MNPNYLWLIPAFPLAGFLLNGTLGRRLPRPAVTAIALLFTIFPVVIVAMLWSHLLGDHIESMETISRPWIAITGFQVSFAFAVDHLTLIMLSVVTGVGFLIHLYSAGYMAHEDGYWRFFAYLNLFMFFMSVLVLSANFLLLFIGWEGVGLASYLLIGFYFRKKSAADAGKKAFIVNRIGDFGFLLAMFLLIAHFGTLSFAQVFAQISAGNQHGGFLTAIALLLLVGAAGKIRPDPPLRLAPRRHGRPPPPSPPSSTPQTMVTAGVLPRSSLPTPSSTAPPTALIVVACIGAATAIFAACMALVQHDIKRVLAYSTVSQLGYMFPCLRSRRLLRRHLPRRHPRLLQGPPLPRRRLCHPRPCQENRTCASWGGLRKRIPITFWTMTAGVFAIAGIPPFAGFFSKDENPLPGLRLPIPRRQDRLGHRPTHRRHDQLLHVSASGSKPSSAPHASMKTPTTN